MKITDLHDKLTDISFDYYKQNVERDVLIGEFLNHYCGAIKEKKLSLKRELTNAEENDIFQTLISKSSIQSINESSTNRYLKDKDKYIVKNFFANLGKQFVSDLLIKILTTLISFLLAIYLFREPIFSIFVELIKK